MTCKDCIHESVCDCHCELQRFEGCNHCNFYFCEVEGNAENCTYFKDKSLMVELPFVAMVEQHIKNGKFDKRYTAHNGKYAVVYVDKTKWTSPLIDICERHYDRAEAEKVLKERIENETQS